MSEQKVIGSIHLLEEERAVVCYEIGYSIHPRYRRLGYGIEAIKAVLDYSFEHTPIKMVTASVFEGNEKSMKMLEKLGFKYEGITHKAMHHCKEGAVNLVNYYIES